MIGNAGMLAEPNLAGAAVADSMAASTAAWNSDVINSLSSACAKK